MHGLHTYNIDVQHATHRQDQESKHLICCTITTKVFVFYCQTFSIFNIKIYKYMNSMGKKYSSNY